MGMGHRIRQLRQERGWTLEQLSEKSGVDIGTISALEMRDSKRSIYTAALAEAIGVDVAELMASATAPSGAKPGKYKPAGKTVDLKAREPSALPWPIADISPREWALLTPDDVAEVRGFVKALIARRKRHAA